MYLKPTSIIKVRLGIEPNGPVQSFLTQTCYNHMDKYVPIDEGNLRSNVSLTSDTITYKSPYAHYMYEGLVMGPNVPLTRKGVEEPIGWFSPIKPKYYTGKIIKYKKAGTGDHWDKRMKSAEITQVMREVQEFIDR